jgi:type IV secretion system protein TrbI
MKNPSDNLLHKILPKAKQINKPVMAAVLAVVMLVLLFAFFGSLTQAPATTVAAKTPVKTGETKKSTTETKSEAPWMADLPETYADSQKVDNYLAKRFPGQGDVAASTALKAQLQALESSQRALKVQIEQLKKQPAPASGAQYNDYLDREAMSSAIFFAGGAPHIDEKLQPDNAGQKGNKLPTKDGTHAPPYFPRDTYDGQNMQKDKIDFLGEKVDTDVYNQHSLQEPLSKYVVQAGTVIPGILQTKIVSDLPGVITAMVRNNVYDSVTGQYLLIPKGSKLIGEYSSKISYGQNKLQVKFTRLIRPDGSSIVLPNQPGINDEGVAGFEDQVDNHWGKVLGSAALMTVFNLPAIVAQNQDNNNRQPIMSGNAVVGYQTSLGQTMGTSALESLGKTSSQIGSSLVQKSLDIQPTILIDSGYHFSIMVTKDLILKPVKTQ